ncbi:emp24/gp25L/p24 family/GOLD-domain-containing protein [Neocallimastix lanati (nom. inval.)]|jgi:hypothetical protein|uniref:GOLD domain-containing protein n=1 Tax=Neocallimastix californiae TaxID=1754190 RepID=A0A1Y2F503_9FUNG|nr:emp24/gp25L/p24 family/GOLD-domain-containing protein [Neocallimastix sp. JGI-2020a]ORY78747.1 hypothetical protein LY90DRAFT_398863 [Neocallimastix californiae]|eukprot:ORY78747.1 hypothetical protein LY90DRAFT_398863 [Neocallimastix californiae]
MKYFTILTVLLTFVCSINAISFSLYAGQEGSPHAERCFIQQIGADILVAGTVAVTDGDHQKVSVEITDNVDGGSLYWKRLDIKDEVKFSFTTVKNEEIKICFRNVLDKGFVPSDQYYRNVFLSVETGPEAMDYSEIAKTEKLKPVEIELRKLEGIVEKIVEDMEKIKQKEIDLRNTNESTNERVHWFSLWSIAFLICLGLWQLYYLRKFFQTKKLI